MLCEVALGRPFQLAHTKFISKEDLNEAGIYINPVIMHSFILYPQITNKIDLRYINIYMDMQDIIA